MTEPSQPAQRKPPYWLFAILPFLALLLFLAFRSANDLAAETYWVPEFALATLQPSQTELRAKLGGLPWGFPPERWPLCKECGNGLAHLAQIPHVPRVFDLGSESAVLHVFQCEGDGVCSTWDPSTGATVTMMLDCAELGKGLTAGPPRTPVTPEAWIVGWEEHATPPDVLASRRQLEDIDRWYLLPESITNHTFGVDTKTGGLPYWTGNGPGGAPGRPFEYLAQIGTYLHLEGLVPSPDEAGTTIRVKNNSAKAEHVHLHPKGQRRPNAPFLIQTDGPESYYMDWANLGSDGTGYLYIDRTQSPAEVYWFWNR